MKEDRKKSKHRHGEAFMLMTYVCNTCLTKETLWNSRDGVTPFTINCKGCNGLMYHIDFHKDVYAPKHQLHPGQRFFRDGTPEEAEKVMEKRIAYFQTTYPLTPEQKEELLQQVRDGTFPEFQPGWPMIDQIPLTKPN